MAPEKVRGFTEIEIVLIERIVKQVLQIMNNAWANVIDSDFRLSRLRQTPSLPSWLRQTKP